MTPKPGIADRAPRILIVDDERHNRQLMEIMLTPEGFHLLTAASGEEALDMVEKEAPDLILLDIMMPGMDGYEVASKIKGNLATKDIPVIMVTALGDRNARMLGLEAGAEDFLTKPVDRAELVVRVKNLARLKTAGDDKHHLMLEDEVGSRTADLVNRTETLEQQAIDREQAGAALRLLTDRLSLATAVARLGVWEWDLANDSLTWDATMFDMYGLPHQADLPYASWAAAVLPEDLPAVEAGRRGSIDAKGQGSSEYRIVLPDGMRRSIASVERVILDYRGNVSRVIGVDMDVTERKSAEEALELIRQDQLRFKDDFLSHVSHELRSPLTAIKQFTSILLGGLAGELNKEQREYQEIVLKNIGQLQSMIDDLLEVTRLETGKLTIALESVSLGDAVTDSFNTLQETARARGITLSCTMPPDLAQAYADQTRVRQILIILLDNAIKFTPEGGAVTVLARLHKEDPRFLLLEVSDTGCGISPETTERIFERLYQVSEPVQTSRKGLGLGLYICKELVTRQGGRIWAQRREEKGSTFSFTLPVFSLYSTIAPLFRNDKWPAESVALVMVEAQWPGAWPSAQSREEWSQEVRDILQRCLLPDLDVLLPSVSPGAQGERIFVAAFAADAGTAILVNRIRGQLERAPGLNPPGLTIAASYTMLPPWPRDAEATTEAALSGMATHLIQAMTSHIFPGCLS